MKRAQLLVVGFVGRHRAAAQRMMFDLRKGGCLSPHFPLKVIHTPKNRKSKRRRESRSSWFLSRLVAMPCGFPVLRLSMCV